MPRYATQTEVSVERSRAEIEETLRRYGSTEFVSGYNATSGMIQFSIAGLSSRKIEPVRGRRTQKNQLLFDFHDGEDE